MRLTNKFGIVVASISMAVSAPAMATVAFSGGYFETSYLVAAEPGSIYTGSLTTGTTTPGGGLCPTAGGTTNGCVPLTGSQGSGAGTVNASGTISFLPFPVGSSAGENFLLTLTLTPVNSPSPSIFDITLNGLSVATTPIVSYTNGTTGPLTLSFVVNGNQGTPTLGVTNLLQQYIGVSDTDTLPGLLNPADASLDGGQVSTTYNTTKFDLTGTIVPDPEPASMSLFAAGLAGLGMVRRRFRRA